MGWMIISPLNRFRFVLLSCGQGSDLFYVAIAVKRWRAKSEVEENDSED